MFFLPLPSRAHDRLQVGKTRSPPQFPHEPLRTGAKDSRIPGTPTALLQGHLSTQFPLHHTADLPNRITCTGSDVVSGETRPVLDSESRQVGLGYVHDMNVIAQACTIRRRVVMAMTTLRRMVHACAITFMSWT